MTDVDDRRTPSDGGGGLFISPFSAFGDHEGVGWRRYDDLSPKWIGICKELMTRFGGVFDHTWSAELSHLRTKLTSAEGAGICTVFINDQVACSMLLMTGMNTLAEQDIIRLYVSSLEKSVPLGLQELGVGSFSRIASLAERPLMVIIPYPDKSIAEEDRDIVREISWHFAAAFIQVQRH